MCTDTVQKEFLSVKAHTIKSAYCSIIRSHDAISQCNSTMRSAQYNPDPHNATSQSNGYNTIPIRTMPSHDAIYLVRSHDTMQFAQCGATIQSAQCDATMRFHKVIHKMRSHDNLHNATSQSSGHNAIVMLRWSRCDGHDAKLTMRSSRYKVHETILRNDLTIQPT